MIPLAKSKEVQAAEAGNMPVVALESTIITHGLPWPRNLETALLVEETVRTAGAVPATIAVIGGVIQAGLDKSALETLAQARNVSKLSRADLAPTLATGGDGSTTVAATMICAQLAGIACFATGGIGGVHRGAETSFDISADLDELSKTPVTVVCAGAKAILDIPKTLEALETRGVPVIGWRTDDFPAFWSASSGLPVPLRMDDAETIARAHRLRGDLGLEGGQLVVNPISAGHEIPYLEISPAIESAIEEAEAKGITGKAVTPFLLEKVLEATQGRSLEANIALVCNNARLAAEIAVALNRLD
ncbi:pseudouridine-5'-phosphate glycosidase [Hwanghaeella grinnelliae]|uniref:Pseudouridine-5'-phosphate glycosidase n=1 Tax=Hwanghaeella grinnelliae TaxID=2500179 RepID=A0A3S2VQJ7_9PROT|nr:pseudouridine-5'-phosphate glycosidase [Hwanghaeella grinnelliae]RVU37942.1 pseudouridine-5'-phosphate glycosidase [Hwanghaeella grinnelliae]